MEVNSSLASGNVEPCTDIDIRYMRVADSRLCYPLPVLLTPTSPLSLSRSLPNLRLDCHCDCVNAVSSTSAAPSLSKHHWQSHPAFTFAYKLASALSCRAT